MPFVQQIIPSEQRIFNVRGQIPVNQPKRPNVFKKWIVTAITQNQPAKWRWLMSGSLANGLAIPLTCDQKRMERTMFLPTPKLTIASSSFEKSLGFSCKPRMALGSHV